VVTLAEMNEMSVFQRELLEELRKLRHVIQDLNTTLGKAVET
jgi:hypothetical protein